MTEEPSDRALCESIELQATLLRDAYATEDATAIDHALMRADRRQSCRSLRRLDAAGTACAFGLSSMRRIPVNVMV